MIIKIDPPEMPLSTQNDNLLSRFEQEIVVLNSNLSLSKTLAARMLIVSVLNANKLIGNTNLLAFIVPGQESFFRLY